MMRIAFGLYFALCLFATIKSQFIKLSHEILHIGDDVALTCTLPDDQKAKDVANYVWYFNNKKVINDEYYVQNGNELLIKNVSPSSDGYYSCVVEFTNSGAKLVTPKKYINVNDNSDATKVKNHRDKLDSLCSSVRIPKLCRSKRNKNEEEFVLHNVQEGTTTTLECQLENVNEKNSVKWLKDGKEIFDSSVNASESRKFDVDESSLRLTINDISEENAGIYDCEMFNERNEFIIKSKSRYNVIVQGRLKFTPKPTAKNFELGAMGKIHCKAAGSTKIYWTKEVDEKLPDDVDDINGMLIFNKVTLEHKGNYTCTATNDEETIKTSIEVGIMPSFEVAPQEHVDVVELQSVLLDCVGFGSPKPTIKWDYESTLIKPESDERFHIYDNGSLLLQEARQDDSGRYGCTIGNPAGFKRRESHVMVKLMDSHSSFEDSEEESSFIISKAVLMTCLVAIIYISLVFALLLWCRNKRQKSRGSEDPENKEENDDTASDGDEKEPLNHETKSSRNKVHQHNEKQKKLKSSPSSTLIIDHLMIHHDQLIDLTKIGRGEFGEVLVGDIIDSDLPSAQQQINRQQRENGTDEIETQKRITVLVKSMSKIKDESFFVEFRRQIDLFRAVDSLNVVKLYALCFEKEHHFMILEHGQDLRAFLVDNADTISVHQALKYCRQIVCAVEAIAKSKLTHRDIALRNCVITKDTVKLSSIAMCKDKHANEYVKFNNRMIPLRHCAPEVLEAFAYSTASDVYACALTIWEVLHSGAVPFEATANEEFLQKLQGKTIDYSTLLEGGKIPNDLQKTLLQCWSLTISERLTPEDLIQAFDGMITNQNGDTK